MADGESNNIKGFSQITEQVLSGIVQSIEAAVVLHDRKLEVVFVNKRFETIFEIKATEAIGRSPMDFLPEFDKRHKEAILSRLISTLINGIKSKYHEFPYCSPSGKYRHLYAISIPIFDKKKNITHVMSVIHDITGRKELEKEAVKAAKLSSIADMAYTLTHEINNPRTGMKLGLFTLYDSLKKEENINVLDNVMRDLNRIQNIVQSFLDVKKKPPTLGKEKIAIIGDIIENVLFHLAGQLDRKKINVDNNLYGGEGFISVDRDRIHQVLLNVFLNAIQATPENGSIAVSTKITNSLADAKSTDSFLRISLTDTGVGIEQNKFTEIFQPFYSTKSGGTGLGLSICKNIISAHQGFLKIESNRGMGTTVNIYLPASVQ